MIIQEPVQAAIWHCLNNYAYADATFLAERLFSEIRSEDTVFILATCYYRTKRTHEAFWLLDRKEYRAPRNRYLLAKCAFDLKMFSCVEKALTNKNNIKPEHLDGVAAEFGDIACFAYQLIAQICLDSERNDLATEANRRALKLNPFLWQPFKSLCDFGQDVNPNDVYKFENADIFQTCQESFNSNSSFIFAGCEAQDISLTDSDGDSNRSYSIYATPVMDQHSAEDRFNTNTLNTSSTISVSSVTAADLSMTESSAVVNATPFHRQFKYLSNISPSTPSFGWLQSPIDANNKSLSPTQQQIESNEQNKSNRKSLRSTVTNMDARRDTPIAINKPVFSQTGNTTPRSQNTIAGQNVRRSSRLFTSNSVKENSKTPIISKFAAPRSPPRKNKQRLLAKNLTTTALNEINAEKHPVKPMSDLDKEKIETITSADEIKIPMMKADQPTPQPISNHQILQMRKRSAEGLINLLRSLAHGYQQLTLFNFAGAIQAFESTASQQKISAWVQGQIARVYYESRDYVRAAAKFHDLHEREPYRMELMDIYSSVLWQLQREVQLAALAQDLKSQDKLSPITWCVLGNCFSLQKEHETAIKYFERAVQVSDDFAYSYTLLGHELITIENLDKAMSCFRTALIKDPRHYNAWYGIGSIYAKQERFGLAEFHFKRALEIHPRCSVIMVHIGVMQFHLSKISKALETMNAAIELDPANPLSKYQRASMYFQCGRHIDALLELQKLKELVPKESIVYYIIGKIHKKLGNVDLALMHFSWATELDPKGTNTQIKDALEPNMMASSSSAPVNVSANDNNESNEQQPEISLEDSFEIGGNLG